MFSWHMSRLKRKKTTKKNTCVLDSLAAVGRRPVVATFSLDMLEIAYVDDDWRQPALSGTPARFFLSKQSESNDLPEYSHCPGLSRMPTARRDKALSSHCRLPLALCSLRGSVVFVCGAAGFLEQNAAPVIGCFQSFASHYRWLIRRTSTSQIDTAIALRLQRDDLLIASVVADSSSSLRRLPLFYSTFDVKFLRIDETFSISHSRFIA